MKFEICEKRFYNYSFTDTSARSKICIDRFRIQEFCFINPDEKFVSEYEQYVLFLGYLPGPRRQEWDWWGGRGGVEPQGWTGTQGIRSGTLSVDKPWCLQYKVWI